MCTECARNVHILVPKSARKGNPYEHNFACKIDVLIRDFPIKNREITVFLQFSFEMKIE